MGVLTHAVSQKLGLPDEEPQEVIELAAMIKRDATISVFIFIGLVPGKNNHCPYFKAKFF